MKNHKDLDVWKKSIELVEDVYRMTKNFPPEEQFGLISQMKRSAISISSNIAEGAGREGKQEFKRFLSIALGSLSELETQLIIAQRLKFLEEASVFDQIRDIRKMICGLITYLKNRKL